MGKQEKYKTDEAFRFWAQKFIVTKSGSKTSLKEFFLHYEAFTLEQGIVFPLTKFSFSRRLNSFLEAPEFTGKFRIYTLSQKFFLGLDLKPYEYASKYDSESDLEYDSESDRESETEND